MSIEVTYDGGSEIAATEFLTQWATGQTVTVTGLEFSGSLYARSEVAKKSKEAYTTRCSGASGGTVTCPIPDCVLAKSGLLVVNLVDVSAEEGTSTVKLTVKIPVRDAAMPSDWNPDYANVVVIQDLVDKVESAVASVDEAAERANGAAAAAEKAVAAIPADYKEAMATVWKEHTTVSEDYLKSGDDLNSISKPCTRVSIGSSVTGGVSNVPSGVTGQFIVYTIAAEQDPSRLGQVLFSVDSNGTRIWTRSGAGSSWSVWAELPSMADVTTYVSGYQGTPADGTVSAAKIVNGAVTEAKLADESVSSAKIVNGAVTHAKLAVGSVVEGKIGSGVVTTAKLADAAVTTAKVADKTINESKLTDALSVKLNQRKGAEVFAQEFTVAAGSTIRVTLAYNQTHSENPFILPTVYGASYANVTLHIEGVNTTKFEIVIKNNTSSSVTNWFFCLVLSRN